jgi:hypothetical protein
MYRYKIQLKFEVLVVESMKMAIFWVVALTLMIEAGTSCETLVSIYLMAWCYTDHYGQVVSISSYLGGPGFKSGLRY